MDWKRWRWLVFCVLFVGLNLGELYCVVCYVYGYFGVVCEDCECD